MRISNATLLVCTVLVLSLFHNLLLAVDDPPPLPQPGLQATGQIRSFDKAVVGNVVYGLEEEEGRLCLTSQPLDGADRELKKTELKFAVPKDDQVVELSLAKMGEKNLVAVVKLRRGDEYEFHCLTFIGPWGGGHLRERHAFYQTKFLSTRDDLRILALSGKRNTAFVALGQLGWDDDLALESEGVFYFSSCPWPPEGQLAPFRAKSAKPPID